MLSDEEKKAIKEVKHFNQLTRYWQEEEYEEKEIAEYIVIVLNLIEKQQKEIEELKEKNKHITKETVEFVNSHYISKGESAQKEKQAYIDGTNAADKLCNKKWENKIKAKIEPRLKELDENMKKEWKEYGNSREYQDMEDEWNFLQSLLEKE